jgi:hypothetical protein
MTMPVDDRIDGDPNAMARPRQRQVFINLDESFAACAVPARPARHAPCSVLFGRPAWLIGMSRSETGEAIGETKNRGVS